jgi:hypothetical protein
MQTKRKHLHQEVTALPHTARGGLLSVQNQAVEFDAARAYSWPVLPNPTMHTILSCGTALMSTDHE